MLHLRDAIQAHYSDLCKCTEKIAASLRDEYSFDIKTADRMCRALQQHLPRAPLWKYLERWNEICRNVESAMGSLTDKYSEYLSLVPRLRNAFDEGKMNDSAIVEFFTRQTKFWIKGFGVDIEHGFRVEADEEGVVELCAYVVELEPVKILLQRALVIQNLLEVEAAAENH